MFSSNHVISSSNHKFSFAGLDVCYQLILFELINTLSTEFKIPAKNDLQNCKIQYVNLYRNITIDLKILSERIKTLLHNHYHLFIAVLLFNWLILKKKKFENDSVSFVF